MANDLLTCAIIGCGRISGQHIEGLLKAKNTSIVALCDADLARARRLAGDHRLHAAKLFSDYREMLSAVRPNLATVAVPDAEHPAAVAAAAASGAHVLCEKPLALTSESADAMVDMVSDRSLQNGVRMPYRFSSAYRYLRRWIDEGGIGKPFHIRAHLSVGRLSDPLVPIEWRMRRETGGLGALADLGSHMIDLCYFLLDEWTSEIHVASGISKIFYTRRPDPKVGAAARVTAPDAVVCTVSFTSGCLLNLEVSRVSPGDHFLQIDGSEGSARCDGDRVWTYRREKTEHQRPETQFTMVSPDALHPLDAPDLFEEFVRCCRATGERFHPDFSDGARVVRTAAAIYESLAKEEDSP